MFDFGKIEVLRFLLANRSASDRDGAALREAWDVASNESKESGLCVHSAPSRNYYLCHS